MAQQALYLRWRPMAFEDVVGQEHVTYTLRNAITAGRIGHAYLFSGPRGTGKTTMARLLAKAVNCLHEDPMARPCNACAYCLSVNDGRFLDLIEIDAASHTSVDDVRELRDRIAFAPNEGRYKVYIIDEVHRFSGAAFDALLKTIEEPPEHAIFVLATTEIHKVPQTIQSRCQRFDFRRIPLMQIVDRLRQIVEAEGMQAEDLALEMIARQATGSLRDSISLLDQLMPEPGTLLTLDLAQAILGTAGSETVLALVDALIGGDAAAGLYLINQAVDAGLDMGQLTAQAVEHLRAVLVVQTGGAALLEASLSPDALAAIAAQAEHFPRRALLDALRLFNEAASAKSLGSGWQPQLPLEMAFLESVNALYEASEPARAPAPSAAPPAAAVPTAPGGQPTGTPAPAEQPAKATKGKRKEAPAQEPGQPATPALDIQMVSQRWREVYAYTRQLDPKAGAVLNSGQLLDIDGDTIVLSMQSEIMREKLESPGVQEFVEQALQEVFGQTLHVQGRVDAGGGARMGAPSETLAEDSLAAFAVNQLGGRVSPAEDEDDE